MPLPKQNNKREARRQARQYALQAIYAWQLSNNSLSQVASHFLSAPRMQETDSVYFNDLLAGVLQTHATLDQQLQPHLTRSLQELDPIEKAILRLALYELTQHREIPYKVVINEAIELAKCFGAQESHKFINGVLDNIQKSAARQQAVGSRQPCGEQ
jgi:transcription antitermination protein NusB